MLWWTDRHRGGNSYQLRRRAAAAHVCTPDNTIYTFKAKRVARFSAGREAGCASSAAIWHHHRLARRRHREEFVPALQNWKQHHGPTPFKVCGIGGHLNAPTSPLLLFLLLWLTAQQLHVTITWQEQDSLQLCNGCNGHWPQQLPWWAQVQESGWPKVSVFLFKAMSHFASS